jgi:TRAP-type mannitol/chloroaromatic compound transport system permease large subunit
LIILPVFAPIVVNLDFTAHMPPYASAIGTQTIMTIWFTVLVAINLQTSFLTPPFGYALFYLKGIAPREVNLMSIYRGIIPFVLCQLLALVLVVMFPQIALWLPFGGG